MSEDTIKTYRGNVLLRSQFWIFTIAMAVISVSVIVEQTVTSTVCLEILGMFLYIHKNTKYPS